MELRKCVHGEHFTRTIMNNFNLKIEKEMFGNVKKIL
jgi:hypothetical protein